jgi:acyl carrier protein
MLATSQEIETLLVQVCRECLQRDNLASHDDLFDLGATSLQMVAIVFRMKEALQGDFGLEVLSDGATITALAARLAQHGRSATAAA